MPSPDAPLTGSCACGTVAFEVTAAFETAGYCHCKRCQRRSGALWSVNGMVPAEGFAFVRGRDAIRTWEPPGEGLPKVFCGECGGHLYSDGGTILAVRLGAVDDDPGIRPEWHQWLESAPDWGAIPEDGLPRFQRRRENAA
jgi:hypothetical protein